MSNTHNPTTKWRQHRHMLLAGYIRESEQQCKITIPDIVHFTTHQYCRELMSSALSTRSRYPFLGTQIEPNLEQHLQKAEYLRFGTETLTKSTEFRTVKHGWSTSFDRLAAGMDKHINTFLLTYPTNNSHQLKVHIVDIQCGSAHLLFLTNTGVVYSIGANDSGQCGICEASPSPTNYIVSPQQIRFPHDAKAQIKSIAAGKIHSLFIDDRGRLLVCGYNYCGQLGLKRQIAQEWGLDDDDEDEDDDVFPFHGGHAHADDGGDDVQTSRGSGSDTSRNDLQNSSASYPPFRLLLDSEDEENEEDNEEEQVDHGALCVRIPTVNVYFEKAEIECSSISCGQYHSVVVAANGDCYTFGHNAYGNLGNGTIGEWGDAGCEEPHKLQMDAKVKQCASGYEHNVLLTQDNGVVVFGDNSHQQCSRICKEKLINSPMKLSKHEEFGIDEECYVSAICCSQNQSLIIYDRFERV
eukprot:CAMPEP_0197042950 /NCGR_PEP_ID=MMETSP1384-20130603/19247_1 /TAXON_ID=29189 /ORGANISM="Ammonia sp." /LENGTH=466 /DNA_ID=CAMNT_0042474157 /DNA_START=45 /DNA_END=1445 /DNA_ORIENTATION=-